MSLFASLSPLHLDPLHLGLLFSSALFCLGLVTALARSNTILVLLGVELMLNAANINFIAFASRSQGAAASTGVLFAIFSIAVAAAEAAVGLALIIAIHRHRRSVRLQDANALKG